MFGDHGSPDQALKLCLRGVRRRKSGTGPASTVDFPADFIGHPGSLRACAQGGLMARTGRSRVPFRPILVMSRACCRSSVVEHSLGKGEVVSSILPGSTSYAAKSMPLQMVQQQWTPGTCSQNEARKCVQVGAKSVQSERRTWFFIRALFLFETRVLSEIGHSRNQIWPL
jgi:hypothetical protein